MIVVRDYSQSASLPRVSALLSSLGVGEQDVLTFSDGEPLKRLQGDQILLITPLSTDWLGYHTQFVQAHMEKTTSWIAVVTGDNPVAVRHMERFFERNGIGLRVFDLNSREPEALAAEIRTIKAPRPASVLLYSVRPSCGKKTLKTLLERYLDGWTIETAEEDLNDPLKNALAESDAAVKVIVSDRFEELCYGVRDETLHPFFALTMPDRQVALYLQTQTRNGPPNRPRWGNGDLNALARWAGLTAEAAEKRLFFISPLYELWRLDETDPRMDPRFVLWDTFGLPLPRDAYRSDGSGADAAEDGRRLVRDFLAQFTQGETLAAAISGQRVTGAL